MFKIIVKGEAKTDYKNISELSGIDCQDNFAEYFDRGVSYEDAIEDGYMHFTVEDGKLMTITEYTSKRRLSGIELENLKEYTQGQWSDGIGEGFEQNECMIDDDGEEVFISPWFSGQVIQVTQEEIL